MRRGWILVFAIAVPVALCVVPDVRLARQTAAARREGLWTTGEDVRRAIGPTRPEDNAWPSLQREPQALPIEFRISKASPSRLRQLRSAYATPPMFRDLHVGVAKPRLDFGRDWDRPGLYEPEAQVVRELGQRLIAAASLGVAPRRNLVAAARLAALALQEPTFVAARVGGELACQALAADPSVEPLLGPPPDYRDRLRETMLEDLKAVRAVATAEGRRALGMKDAQVSLLDKLAHCHPLAAAREAALIGDWRTLFMELPRDPADLEGAARVLDRRLPAIDRHIDAFCFPVFAIRRDSKILGSLVRLRDARRTASKAWRPP